MTYPETYSVTILCDSGHWTVPAHAGDGIGELLRAFVPSFAQPCAGNHTCGKCRVQVAGSVEPLTDAERRLLSAKDQAAGIRLACCCRVAGDVTVTIAAQGASDIIAWHKLPVFAYTESGYGLAVDIGTTTVAMQLFHRATGKCVAERLAENAQRGFGADVISRVEACKTHKNGQENGLDTLSRCIREQLEQMAEACMQEASVTEIMESVVTGNTTMLHLYEGIDPASLAVVPFRVPSYFGTMSRWTLAHAPVYLPRCIGAYVGADIVCAILASDMCAGGTQLLTDVGTNGEMVLAQDGHLLCCATAAGPAFEGAGLSCGMPAAPGAIRAVSLQRTNTGDIVQHHTAQSDVVPYNRQYDIVQYETVDGKPAIGICGSGILDALAVMRETEVMEDTGYLEEESFPIGDSGVQINQRDVRQIQLAKSAICAGLLTLLEEANVESATVRRFAIAGGFGSSLNVASACAIGLFPSALKDKTEFIGNAALGGAAMLLLNRSLRAQTEQMAQAAVELELSASPTFMDHYIDCMQLEPCE